MKGQGGQIDPPPPQEKLPRKSPALLGLNLTFPLPMGQVAIPKYHKKAQF